MEEKPTQVCDPEYENHLIKNWSAEMQLQDQISIEPILDDFTMNIIKIGCDIMKMDLQVFFLAADILENYIHQKNRIEEFIADPMLMIGADIFLTAKYFGAGCELKMQIINKFLKTVTGQSYTKANLALAEQEILNTLSYRLPFVTILDDFNTFYEYFTETFFIKQNFKNLCLEIMQMIYLFKKSLFGKLDQIYRKETLKHLIGNRYYLITGTVTTALKLTNYEYVLDIEAVLQNLFSLTNIPPDHIKCLCEVLVDFMRNKN